MGKEKKVVTWFILLKYWLNRLAREIKIPTLVIVSLHCFYISFFNFEWLVIEIEIMISMVLVIAFVWFFVGLIKACWILPNLMYELEEEGDFNFALINASEGLYNPEEQRHLKNALQQKSYLFSLQELAFGLLLLSFVLIAALPQRHRNMGVNILRAYNLLPPPNVQIDYSKIIKEGESPRVKNISDHFLWVKWNGLTSGQWQKIESGESYLGNDRGITKSLDVSLRYGKRTYYQNFPIKTILKPRIGRIEIETISPFNSRESFRGRVKINAFPKSKLLLRLYPVAKKEFDYGTLRLKNSVFSNVCELGEVLELNCFYPGGVGEYELQVARLDEQIYSEILKLSLKELSNTPPKVDILSPEKVITLKQPQKINVSYLAKDDASLKRLSIITSSKFGVKTNSLKIFSGFTNIYRGKYLLNPREVELYPGDTLSYFILIEDFYGLQDISVTNSIVYQSIYDSINKLNDEQLSLQSDVRENIGKIDELGQDLEKIKVLAEKGDLKEQTLKSFKQKLENVKKDISLKSRATQASIAGLKKDNFNLDPSLIKKLKEIEENLKNLDQEFLSKINQTINNLIGKNNLSKEDIDDFLSNTGTEELKQKMDEILGGIEQLKKIQKFSKLESLINQLSEHHADLVNEVKVNQSTKQYNLKKPEVEKLLKEFVSNWSNTTTSFSNEIELNTDFLKDMNLGKLNKLKDAFRQFSPQSSDDPKFAEFINRFEQLRRNTELFNRSFQSIDWQKIVDEIDKQVVGLAFQSDWLQDFSNDEIFDLQLTDITVLKKIVSLFISQMEGVLKVSRANLYELLIGYIPGMSSFFKVYDELLSSKLVLKKKLDPASSTIKVSYQYLIKQLDRQRENYLILSHRLIQLKQLLEQNQNNQSNEKQLNNIAQRQKKLNRRNQHLLGRGKLNSFQKNYLRKMAKEQQAIRAMLEAMRQKMSSQNRQTLENGLGKGSDVQSQPFGENGPGDIKQVQKQGESRPAGMLGDLIEEMRKLEDDLGGYQGKSKEKLEKIFKRQKMIEEKFLQFNRGISKREPDKKQDTERTAEIDRTKYVSRYKKLDTNKLLKQLEKDIQINKYPPEYRKRILRFINALKIER